MCTKRLIVIDNKEAGNSFYVTIDEDEAVLAVDVRAGRNPFMYEVYTAIGRVLVKHGSGIEVLRRNYRYRFCYRKGKYGCRDTFIEKEFIPGFPTRTHLLHVSCFGKVGSFRCNLYDFLDMAVADGKLGIASDHWGEWVYSYNPGDDPNYFRLKMKVIEPRYIEYEDGWCNPGEISQEIVPLEVCHIEPWPEPEDEEPESEDEEPEPKRKPESPFLPEEHRMYPETEM